MEILNLPISPFRRSKLISAGYMTFSSLTSVSVSQLANKAQTAWDMLLEEHTQKHTSTSCEDLDTILGGDKHCKEVTEIGEGLLSSTVTFHFHQDFDDLALRTRVPGGLSLKLMKLAKKFSLSVVLLNQVTTKFTKGSFQLTLALGCSWSHSRTNRAILYWNGNDRHAYIDKSPSLSDQPQRNPKRHFAL